MMQAMASAARPYVRGGFATTVDFSIGPWFPPVVQPYLKNMPVDLVVLCPSKAVCAERIKSRDGTTLRPVRRSPRRFRRSKGFRGKHRHTRLRLPTLPPYPQGLSKGLYRIN